MKKNLIDRDELIYAIRYELFDWESVNDIDSKTVLKQLCRDIINQPVIDAEPVIVRCEDCISWKRGKADPEWGYCELFDTPRGPEGYCCSGVRNDSPDVNDQTVDSASKICQNCERSREIVKDVLYYCAECNLNKTWYDSCSKFVKGMKR